MKMDNYFKLIIICMNPPITSVLELRVTYSGLQDASFNYIVYTRLGYAQVNTSCTWYGCNYQSMPWPKHITITSQWTSWHLKLTTTRRFIQLFVSTNIKENVKVRVTGPMWMESTGDRWIPVDSPHNGLVTRKAFSWRDVIMGVSTKPPLKIHRLWVSKPYRLTST